MTVMSVNKMHDYSCFFKIECLVHRIKDGKPVGCCGAEGLWPPDFIRTLGWQNVKISKACT